MAGPGGVRAGPGSRPGQVSPGRKALPVRPAGDQVALLAGLPLTATWRWPAWARSLFCHATPRDDEEVVLADSRLERWADVLGSVAPEVAAVVCGHTHMPFCRLAHGRLVVNPGSVGMPYGRAGAHWALLGPGVQLRRTVFGAAAACARIAAESSYPAPRNGRTST